MASTVVDDILRMTAVEMGAAYRRDELSPVEVAAACLSRIAEADPGINAFCLVDAEVTLDAAQRSQSRYRAGSALSALDGIPVAVKDVVTTAGWPTRKGSRAPSAAGDAVDAPSVDRVRAAGGVLVGKTTTPEFGWKAVTDSPLTGATRNPWDTRTTAGGSSGGSAAAVAAGMTPLALGTDGAGSIRIPSSFCGVVGLKPTQGLVPQWPPSPFGILSHLGPHARTSQDAALLLSVIAGSSPWDPPSVRPGSQQWLPAPLAAISSLRIAYSPDFGRVDVRDDVARCVRSAVDTLQALGARVDVVPDVGFVDPLDHVEVLWNAGAARTVERLAPSDVALVEPGLRAIAEKGHRLPSSAYVAALDARVALSIAVERILSRCDVLITPTVPLTAFPVGRDVPPGWPDPNWMSWTPFTYPFNLTGHPALSVPCGLGDDGLPVGVQLVGRRFEDGLLLGLGSHLEAALDFPHLPWSAG